MKFHACVDLALSVTDSYAGQCYAGKKGKFIPEIGIFLCKDELLALLGEKGPDVVNSTKWSVGLFEEHCHIRDQCFLYC